MTEKFSLKSHTKDELIEMIMQLQNKTDDDIQEDTRIYFIDYNKYGASVENGRVRAKRQTDGKYIVECMYGMFICDKDKLFTTQKACEEEIKKNPDVNEIIKSKKLDI